MVKEEALLKEKNQDLNTRAKKMLKQKKVLTCPIQAKEYFSRDNDESIYETVVKLSRKTPSKVPSNPTMQDLLAQVGQTHLELYKTAMRVMTNMQKFLTRVQPVVTLLLLRKKELGGG